MQAESKRPLLCRQYCSLCVCVCVQGAFAFGMLNYLLCKLGQPEADTVAATDVGAGSVQPAFALACY